MMQTFLPYKSMGRSVRCLDNRRLGKLDQPPRYKDVAGL